jgi:RNA polymerase sigma-70 factor (ECF subfamily)
MSKNIEYYFNKKLTDKSFHKIYELSSTQLYGVILRILKKEHLAKECLQEVYVKVYKNFDSYDGIKSKPLTWMSTIARNYAIDFYRKKQLNIEDGFEIDTISDEQIQMLEELEQSENKQQIIKCLKTLKNEVKDAIFMQYFQNKTYGEVANIFKKPENTIKSWVARAMPKLKKCMEELL